MKSDFEVVIKNISRTFADVKKIVDIYFCIQMWSNTKDRAGEKFSFIFVRIYLLEIGL